MGTLIPMYIWLELDYILKRKRKNRGLDVGGDYRGEEWGLLWTKFIVYMDEIL